MIRALLVVFGFACMCITGCAYAPLQSTNKTRSSTIAQPQSTTLGQLFAQGAARDDNRSGVLLLDKGEDALLWRGTLADAAQQAIDAQYFIWKDDNVGTIAAEYLLRAAERGVRVRVLVDAFPIDTNPRYLALLNGHSNIQIRVYNPGELIGGSAIDKLMMALYDFKRFNQRMHNKAYIVDGSVAIVGGRNIANEYYDMHPSYNFRDRDVMAVGPIVGSIADGFDAYWNSAWAIPVEALIELDSGDRQRAEYYTALHVYVADPGNHPERFRMSLARRRQALAKLSASFHWGAVELINDVPGKNDDPFKLDAFGRSGQKLTELALGAREEILVQSPYLVLMPGTFEVLEDRRDKGVQVRIHTNSLAATDSLPAFAGYARQRERILSLGVRIHEQRARPASRRQLIERHHALSDDARFAVHAKTAVFDRESVFIGTFNLDPRSTHLNTEMGLLIKNGEFAREVAAVLEHDMAGENSWALFLDAEDNIRWQGSGDGEGRGFFTDPQVGAWRQLQLFFYSMLPIEKLL